MRHCRWKTRRDGDGAYVITVEGEADLHASGELGDELLDLVAARAGDVALDLANVSLMDSTALALLLRSSRLLRASGGRLHVVAASPPVRRLLELTALDVELGLAREAA